ncbi:MAG: hypothetical protein LBL15_08340 [Oscillospiraceae bacterium]|jgi:hypothetical protein|nr:hypothetical protein [Oscillospiraceae bacterium]
MDNFTYEKNSDPEDSAELSVDSILAEFKAEEQVEALIGGAVSEAAAVSVTEAAVSAATGESAADFTAPQPESAQAGTDFSLDDLLEDARYYEPDAPGDVQARGTDRRAAAPPADGTATVIFEKIPRTDEDAVWAESSEAARERDKYAPRREYALPEDGEDAGPAAREGGVNPLITLIAAASAKRAEKRRTERARKAREEKGLPPEMRPEKAALLYMDQAAAIRLRLLLSVFLSLTLVWLSYGLPAMGSLGSSGYVRTLVCLILMLVSMVVGLDIVTTGLMTLFAKKPGPESLVVLSCLFSAADAAYILVSGNTADGLPFCAVSALSLSFALWGAYLNCRSFVLSFHTAALAKSPSVILSEEGGEAFGRVLVKVQRPVTGFVRKSEEADVFEKAFRLFSPLLIAFAAILSLFCFLAGKGCDNLTHTLSAAFSVCASFSAVFGFALPFYVLTKRLARSGAAVAGYAGCSELGRVNPVVVKDGDIFPIRTLSIANVTIPEGFYPDKVISYTASMVAAAGMGIAPVFTELMKKNGCSMKKVEDFACHEGGGIIARINGDRVYIGSSSFMQLMGIRADKGAGSQSAVYTAINDAPAGIFEINYVPVSSVQRGLVTLLRGSTEPVFAVRDFNITPLLVRQKFRLPRESYDFPSFADRYAISSAETEAGGSVVAMFARGGLNAVAGLVKRGKALYNGLLLCAVLSVLGAFAGLLLMLSMCWTGAYGSAGVTNAISFMLLWLVPVLVIAIGQRR